ncbi:MAG: hypothetical protein CL840_16990 [Crocinitomicaceae bacterium]|nr:hypothetical protein [Crocinitomicaceae bacterium]|tara:strand:- start:14565 stop:15803 length:1239 start_codon:yes stop_codon:yes gene_type:complete
MYKVKYVFLLLWLLLCFTFITIKGIIPGWQEGRSDFSNYYASSVLISRSITDFSFYNDSEFNQKAIENGVEHGAKFTPFPPVTSYLMLPLSGFTELTAKRIWMMLNVLFLALLVVLLKRLIQFSWLNTLLLTSLFCIPLASNFRLGQTYLMFTTMLLVAMLILKEGRWKGAGALIGLAVALKYFPLVYLLYGNRKTMIKTSLMAFLVGLLLWVSPVIFQGVGIYQDFFQHLSEHLQGNIQGQGQHSFNYQSMDALLANLFVADSNFNAAPVINLPGLKPIFKAGFVLGILAIIAVLWSRKKSDHEHSFVLPSIVILGLSALLPVTATYHFLFLIPPVSILLLWIRIRFGEGNLLLAMAILAVLTFNLLPHHIPTIPGSKVINTLVHFPRLYGLIGLFLTFSLLFYRTSKSNG